MTAAKFWKFCETSIEETASFIAQNVVWNLIGEKWWSQIILTEKGYHYEKINFFIWTEFFKISFCNLQPTYSPLTAFSSLCHLQWFFAGVTYLVAREAWIGNA